MVTHLELLLGQISSICPVVLRNSIVKNSTSVKSIWQSIRQHYGFQSNGSHFLDFDNIFLEAGERLENLFQRLMSFVEDLLTPNGNISQYSEIPDRILLASIKPEISQALDSLLDEIHVSHESKVLRTAFVKQPKLSTRKPLASTPKRECPMC